MAVGFHSFILLGIPCLFLLSLHKPTQMLGCQKARCDTFCSFILCENLYVLTDRFKIMTNPAFLQIVIILIVAAISLLLVSYRLGKKVNKTGKYTKGYGKENKKEDAMGTGLAVGMSLGLIMGLLMDNIALGVALGPALGMAIGAAIGEKDKEK